MESEAPQSPETRPSHRPDLKIKDFTDLDRHVVDKLMQTLDIDQLFLGTGDKLTDPSIVEEGSSVIPRARGTKLISVRVHGQWLACKINLFWDRDPQREETYWTELENLGDLRQKPHWHVVLLMCHYINPKKDSNEGCLVLSPLAECNLKQYLSKTPTLGRKRSVARWFGCLATALEHIHAQRIKHKDIKSENILIHGENIIITDLGISHKFHDESESSGDSPGSKMYMAPEVLEGLKRGRRQDTWALLCCFIEMFAYLKDISLPDFRQQLKLCRFYHNYEKVVEWLKSFIPQTTDKDEREILDFLLRSFQLCPDQRPNAPDLVHQIRATGHGGRFIGECCAPPGAPAVITQSTSQTSTISFSTNPQTLKRTPILHFVVTSGNHIMAGLKFPAVRSSLEELLRVAETAQIHSIRSAEKKLLLYIAPVRILHLYWMFLLTSSLQRKCENAKEYLSFCKAFVERIVDAYVSDEYVSSLYDRQLGEQEQPYTTAYFAILIDVILSRCRTCQWDSLPPSID
jgi:serine/threonine protein kinase